MRFETYADRDMLALDLADALASDLETALLHHDQVSLAVPGGTSPGPVFDSLSAARLDWARVHVLLTDERWVAEDHPRSNTALLRQRLLNGPAADAQLMPLYADERIDAAVPNLSAALAPHLPISVLLLGMGADMHTASLFPGAPGVAEAMAPRAPILNIVDPEDQEMRVTLAAHVLDAALSKHLVIFGQDKRDALERAMHLPPAEAPIRAVASDLTVHWAP